MAVVSQMAFDIPFVEAVHSTIHAFLRTSEFGGWEVDGALQNDLFVLNYRRGKATAPPGKWGCWLSGMDLDYPQYVRARGWDGGQSPLMELTVRLRPTGTQRIKVQLEHRLVGPHAELIAKVRERLTEEIQSEIRALIAYLKESYEFLDLPEIVRE